MRTPQERLLEELQRRLANMERQVKKMQAIPVYGKNILTPGTITAEGDATIGGKLGVTALTTLGGALATTGILATGNASVGGTLGVTGLATFTDNITVGGKLGPSSIPTFPAADSTPDVSAGNVFYTADTTTLIGLDYGAGTPEDGHEIVVMLATAADFTHDSASATYPLHLAPEDNWITGQAGDNIRFVFDSTMGSAGMWVESGRSALTGQFDGVVAGTGVFGTSLSAAALTVLGPAGVLRLTPTGVGTFTSGDGTPDVSSGNVFYTAGTGNIVGFDYGAGGEPVEGHLVTVLLKSSVDFTHNVTISNPYPLLLPGAANWTTGQAGDSITFRYNGTAWQTVSRSINN